METNVHGGIKIYTDAGEIELNPGAKFKHDNIDGFITVVKILTKTNEMVVNITYSASPGVPHNDIWNLQHVVWAFERNEYVKLS